MKRERVIVMAMALVGLLAFAAAPAANAETVAWDFDTNMDMDGWTQIYPASTVPPADPAPSLWASYDNWWFGPDPGHLGDGWEDSDTQFGRSPEFTLDAGDVIWLQFLGGASPDAAPVAPSEIPEIAIVDGGFMGVALRDVDADVYVLSASLTAENYDAWSYLTITAEELAGYVSATKKYTLDFIDYNKNPGVGGAWAILGAASVPEPATLSLMVLGGLAVLRRRRRVA